MDILGGNMSESHIKPYVWDQLELVRMLTDLYIKNKSTEEGVIKGMLGDQAKIALSKSINAETNKLTDFLAQNPYRLPFKPK